MKSHNQIHTEVKSRIRIRTTGYIQCCRSGMFIPDLRSWFLAIPDPGSSLTFFVAIHFTKWKIILFCKVTEKNVSQLTKSYSTLYPENCRQALRNMGWGFGKNLSRILDPGSVILVIYKHFFLLKLDKEFHKTLAKRKIIEKKMFPKQHSPNLLTWAEKETIRWVY